MLSALILMKHLISDYDPLSSFDSGAMIGVLSVDITILFLINFLFG